MISDLQAYVATLNVRLSPAALRIFANLERSAEELNKSPFEDSVLLALLETSSRFQEVVDRFGGNVERARRFTREHVADDSDAFPYADSDSYSAADDGDEVKSGVLNLAVAIARASARREVTENDVIEALLRYHDELYPPESNEWGWTDPALHLPYNVLSHVVGRFDASLNVKFREIRDYFEIVPRTGSPAESAPPRLRGHVLRLLEEFPEYHRNCFIIMSFDSSPMHKRIHGALSRVLQDFGFQTLRADDRLYSPDLLDNVLTYAHGCALAVAVHERIQQDGHNPNVAFEVGYIHALGKPICLLKERTVAHLPSDLVGRLYVDFDLQHLRRSLRTQLQAWLGAAKLI